MIPLQLPLSPMRLFAIGVEHPLDAVVERPQHGHVGENQPRWRSGGSPHQMLYGVLPVWQVVFGPRKLRYVAAGILEGDKLAAAGAYEGA